MTSAVPGPSPEFSGLGGVSVCAAPLALGVMGGTVPCCFRLFCGLLWFWGCELECGPRSEYGADSCCVKCF
ncbi:hypothetical protein E2C01_022895 [Portunus trituberculatus]|uniref:Uncharacterized protein n=1 Tax=Portunus trituberculatus TaxID=210409 RepID=A0A5B7E6M8_PORTR|nr:hypothetical protein [Portunus trituberculatus]